ncbi:flagellar protein FlaG [Colwellia hornerae]|uniref:Flagellar protein FlaG n=1 Tax=Colwellia hornerae TaxID=89402 RepID=A0A5C6QK19_9GAMM|nr:flagellar protein FlaG [Colwellia hornerae]TWX54134.1 flagellar protein FlaG [Colwellia hornerae]TWX60909.1 flagellar protein FlaG [Colwellia hornerae]TWX69239.1 flagellar protein FlaG [Colwellia hornerae]
MSIVKSGLDLSSTNLTSEYSKKQDSESDVSLAKGIDNNIAEKNVTQQNVVDKTVGNDDITKPLTPEQLEKVAQQLQDFVGEMNRGLEFTVDKDSGRDVIKVIDKNSGDLVKQYPSEEVLSLVAKLSDMVGGFVDAKV